jgi:hypothetical protein
MDDADLGGRLLATMRTLAPMLSPTLRGDVVVVDQERLAIRPFLNEVMTPANSIGAHVGFSIATADVDFVEFAYWTGGDLAQATTGALEQWVAFDLPVLLAAAGLADDACVKLETTADSPAAGAPPAGWRMTLGPLWYFSQAEGTVPCCQTCLFLQCLPVIGDLKGEERTIFLKLFASRTADDGVTVDCRVNGMDWEAGRLAIAAVIDADWPRGKGFIMRRQLILLRPAPPTGKPPPLWRRLLGR